MHFFNCDRLLRTRVYCAALLAVGLLCGNSLVAFAYQTEDTTLTEYPTTTTTDDTTMESEAPYADFDWAQTIYNEFVIIDVLANDFGMSAPIDPSTVTIVTGPAQGDVVVDPLTGEVAYFPALNYVGSDNFEYTVEDTNGKVSNIAAVFVDVINMPPQMISFIVTEGSANVWLFEGQVGDEELANCTIIFGGLLEGVTTTVNSNGTFSFSKILTEYEAGGVSAQARDELGELSNILYGEVYRF
ncbi:MAG TPA: Ig-like domain-containing protein [Planctomycetaceae bacterium]|nr:Ig-like domain-containing protein [Planctomycetaceae bacterium]